MRERQGILTDPINAMVCLPGPSMVSANRLRVTDGVRLHDNLINIHFSHSGQ